MSIDQTNWSVFLKEDWGLPTDIIFNVIEKDEEKKEDGGEAESDDNDKTAEIKAHKFILAGVSPVFRKEFFGPLKTSKDIVDIKETTIEAFTTLINYVYTPSSSEEFSLKDIRCPQTLCQVLNLAERYQMPVFRTEVFSVLQSLPITSENMMFTATVAKNYAVFEDVSEMLLGNCAKFCETKLKTADDVFTFLNQTQVNFPHCDNQMLLEVMRANAKCPNCKETFTNCKDGKDVTGDERVDVLRIGLVVAKKEKTMQQGVCGFPCSTEFLFPLPQSIGQATVTNLRYADSSCSSFSQGPNMKQHFRFVLKCTGHNKDGIILNLLPDGKVNFVFSCGKAVKVPVQNPFQATRSGHPITFAGLSLSDRSDLNGTGRVKFIPLVGSDTEMKQGVQHQISTRHQCITVMQEYETSSLEELRCKDYRTEGGWVCTTYDASDNSGEDEPIRARVSLKKFLKAKRLK